MTRSAVITGCNGGIGQALVQQFVDCGWFVLGIDQQPNAQPSLIGSAYCSCDLVRFVTDDLYRDGKMQKMRSLLAGQPPLYALINNAAYQVVKPVEGLGIDDWRTTLDTNLLAPFMLSQSWLPDLISAHGCILNIGSIHVKATKPKFVAYATSKAALVGMTQALAVELGGRVRVNALCPAAVATSMLLAGFQDNNAGLSDLSAFHPAGQIALPEEVAKCAYHLCDPAIPFQTGAVLYLDGGIGSRLHDPE